MIDEISREKTAVPEILLQEQQYTAKKLANKIVEVMFATFVQTTNHDIAAEVHD